MTKQELDQHRDHVLELDIEQLRCGVMMQLHTIESLTAERDALKDAARLALDEMENVTYAVLSGAITVDVLRFERTVSALKAVL